jgi:Family of unknown function (DUF6116)
VSSPQQSLVTGFLGRLKFPQLFLLAAGLFLFDLIVPDVLPFVDEILLAIGTMLLGSWQKKVQSAPKPPMKDVTPPDD